MASLIASRLLLRALRGDDAAPLLAAALAKRPFVQGHVRKRLLASRALVQLLTGRIDRLERALGLDDDEVSPDDVEESFYDTSEADVQESEGTAHAGLVPGRADRDGSEPKRVTGKRGSKRGATRRKPR